MQRKMTQFLFMLCALLISALPMYGQLIDPDNPFRERDPNYKKDRQQWMDAMHRTEPGVDYRLLNAAIRESKQRMHQDNRGRAFTKAAADTAIGGYLKGFWQEKGSANQAGRTHTADIDFARGLMYIGSAGGNVWRGTVDGREWTSLNDATQFADIRMVRVLERDGLRHIVVVCNSPSRVMYSDDDGASWQRAAGLENAARWGSLNRGIVVNNDEHTIYVLANEWDYAANGSRAGIYRSDDLGATFRLVTRWKYENTNAGHFDMWTPRYGRAEVFVCHVDTISRIVDDSVLIPLNRVTSSTEVKSSRNIIFQGFDGGDSWSFFLFMNRSSSLSEIHSSSDGGTSWKLRGTVPLSPFRNSSYCVSTVSADTMFCGGVDSYRSYDGGESWEIVNKWSDYYGDPEFLLHADIPEVSCLRDPDGKEIVHVATDGGSYLSYDHLQSVKNISLKSLNISQYYAVYTNRNNMNYVYAGAQDQGFQRCRTDSGKTLDFDQLISGDYGHIVSSDGGNMLWTDYPGFIMLYQYSTRDSPPRRTWDFSGNRLWLPPIVADPRDAVVAYAAVGGTGNQAQMTKVAYDAGQNKLIATLMPFDFAQNEANVRVSSLAISEINPNRWYALTNTGKFYTSSDGGEDWDLNDEFKAMGGHYFYGSNILPSRLQEGKLVIAGSGYSNPPVYVSTDNGTTFAPMDSGMPNTLVYDITATADERFYFAATAVGPYVYITDRGMWFDLGGSDAPDQTYWWVDVIDALGIARFATYGRGIWDFQMTGVVSVPGAPVAAAADRPYITAYPNPARNGTSFTFTVPPGASPILRVYDMLGRVMYEAPPGAIAQGANTLRWNAFEGNRSLPSGAYLAVLSYNGMAAYARVVLTE